jgi:[protein-PII] uridylyltransferase
MATRFAQVPAKRAIIDRRSLADRLGALEGDEAARRLAATNLLKDALVVGRAEIARRLEERPWQGTETAASYAFLTDQILRLAYDFIVTRLYPLHNPTDAERLLLMAVGGYGRGEMALQSDVDIAFVTPWKPTPWTEQVIESMLYLLWDLGLKVGHSSRSMAETMAVAAGDHTVRTALLEARYLWGDERLFADFGTLFQKDVVAGRARQFVTEKLEERNARHQRMGDSRYVVEPNVKEGKGGLRDLPSGSANTPIRSPVSPSSSMSACSARSSFASSSAPSASCGRCGATSTSPPGGPRSA